MNFHVQHSSTILVVIKFIHISKNIIYTFCVHFYMLCPFKNISDVVLIPYNVEKLSKFKFTFLVFTTRPETTGPKNIEICVCVCVCVLTTHENENRKNSIKYLENFQFYNINSSLWESHSIRHTERNWIG